VESMGVLYAVVPVGAFVEPNNEQIQKASRKARSSMFAVALLNWAATFFISSAFPPLTLWLQRGEGGNCG
jgi:hypothetical protein